MVNINPNKTITTLSSEEVIKIRKIAEDYLKDHDFLTNRLLRSVTDINYDQAISFFKKMLAQKVLEKIGAGSGTRYILSSRKKI